MARPRPRFRADVVAARVLRELPVFREQRVIRRCYLVDGISADLVAPGSIERECETCGQPVWYYQPQQPDKRGEKIMCIGCVNVFLILCDIAGMPRPDVPAAAAAS